MLVNQCCLEQMAAQQPFAPQGGQDGGRRCHMGIVTNLSVQQVLLTDVARASQDRSLNSVGSIDSMEAEALYW